MGRALRIGLHSPYFGATYGGGERYLGTAAEVLRDAYPAHIVEIVSTVPVDRRRYEQVLGLDLEGIGLRAGTRRVTALHRLGARARLLRPLRNRLVARQAAASTRDYDLWLGMAYVIPAISAARRSVLLCQFPYRLAGQRQRNDLAAFDPVVCQSDYVRHCVHDLWDRSAEVLYPPIEIPSAEPDWEQKRPVIASVGRFVASGHVKRHDVLVRAFRELCDAGLRGWELHLAGSLHQDAASLAYHASIVEAARGYPIRVRTDLPLDDLQELYRSASIYWHAAGWGVDAAAHPEALEHFGMTTVEAAAHGAVPVVIGLGGQPEVVREGETGFLWTDLPTLGRRTLTLTEDVALRQRMATAGRAASHRFGRSAFAGRLRELVDPIISDLERAR